jgi:hypothetical protein
LFDGIAGREHLERVGQSVSGRTYGNSPLLHRLQQRGLRLGRRAIDFVRKHQVLEDGSCHEACLAPNEAILLDFVQNVGASDVGRQ